MITPKYGINHEIRTYKIGFPKHFQCQGLRVDLWHRKCMGKLWFKMSHSMSSKDLVANSKQHSLQHSLAYIQDAITAPMKKEIVLFSHSLVVWRLTSDMWAIKEHFGMRIWDFWDSPYYFMIGVSLSKPHIKAGR